MATVTPIQLTTGHAASPALRVELLRSASIRVLAQSNRACFDAWVSGEACRCSPATPYIAGAHFLDVLQTATIRFVSEHPRHPQLYKGIGFALYFSHEIMSGRITCWYENDVIQADSLLRDLRFAVTREPGEDVPLPAPFSDLRVQRSFLYLIQARNDMRRCRKALEAVG